MYGKQGFRGQAHIGSTLRMTKADSDRSARCSGFGHWHILRDKQYLHLPALYKDLLHGMVPYLYIRQHYETAEYTFML